MVQAISALATPTMDVGSASLKVFLSLGGLLSSSANASATAGRRSLLTTPALFNLSSTANIQSLLNAVISANTITLKAGVAANSQLALVISYMQALIVAAVATGDVSNVMAIATVAQTQAAFFLFASNGNSSTTNNIFTQLQLGASNAQLPGALLQANVAAANGLNPSGTPVAPPPPPPSPPQEYYGLSLKVIIPLAVILPLAGIIGFAILLAVCLARRKRNLAEKKSSGGRAEEGTAQQQVNSSGAVMPAASSPGPVPVTAALAAPAKVASAPEPTQAVSAPAAHAELAVPVNEQKNALFERA